MRKGETIRVGAHLAFAMVSVHGSVNGEGDRAGHEGGRIRFVGYLKAHKRAAYVLGAMVMVHLSSQYDRYGFVFIMCAAAGPERARLRTHNRSIVPYQIPDLHGGGL